MPELLRRYRPLLSQITGRGLGRRILVWILSISAAAALMATSFQLFFDYKRDVSDLESALHYIQENQLPGLTEAAWSFNRDQLRLQLDGIGRSPWVAGAVVRYGPNEGAELVTGEINPARPEVVDYALRRDAGGHEIAVGHVFIAPNLRGLYRRTIDRVAVVLATQAIKSFIISASILFFVANMITRHLARMAEFARSFEPGTAFQPIALHRGPRPPNDELTVLVDSLNEAYRRVHAAHDLEVRHRERLGEEVAARTFELRRVLAEQELILDNASLGIFIVVSGADGARTIMRANHAAERILGYDSGELVGLDTHELYPRAEAYQVIDAAYHDTLPHGASLQAELTQRRKDGAQILVRIVGTAIDPGDLTQGVIWLFEDVTERRAAEDAVRLAKDTAERLAEAFRLKSEQVANLLDYSGQGFLSFGADLIVDEAYSRACEAMLGQRPAGQDAAAILFGDDRATADLVRESVPDILAERDPWRQSMMLSLLPSEIAYAQRIFKVDYRPLNNDNLMVILTDLSEERRLAERVRDDHRHLAMVVAAVTDPQDFFDTVDSYRHFIEVILPDAQRSTRSLDILARDLYREIHTYKGVLSQFSFTQSSAALHTIEGRLAPLVRDGSRGDPAELVAVLSSSVLAGALDEDLHRLRQTLGEDYLSARDRVTLTEGQAAEIERFADQLLAARSDDPIVKTHQALLVELGRLRKIHLAGALNAFDRTVREVAAQTGKLVRPIQVAGDETVALDGDVYRPFLRALIHLFRNAVAHGIEYPQKRRQAGKNEAGLIQCIIERRDIWLILTVADDGGGVDTVLLVETLVRSGRLNAADADGLSETQRLELVFADGLSTQREADEISGRGAGLAAVQAEVRKLGGKIVVHSERGIGARFEISLPLCAHIRWAPADGSSLHADAVAAGGLGPIQGAVGAVN